MEKAKILIVEDETIIALEMENQLQSLGYEVTSIVDTGEKAIEKAEADKPDIILMDIRIKGEIDGIEAAEKIRNRFGIPVIFSTAYLNEERIERAKITMPFGYVLKPIQERDLKVTIEMALYVSKVDAERRKTEKELKQSEDTLNRMFKFADYMVCIADLTKERFTKISPAFTRHLGWNEKEMLSKPILDFIHPEDVAKTADIIKEQMEKEVDVIQFENRYQTKDGDYRWFEWAANPVPEEGITYSAAYDITERKQMEKALKEHSDQLEQKVKAHTKELQNAQEKLLRKDKLEALGKLAGMLGHEIKAPLGVIMNSVEFLKLRLDQHEDEKISKHFDIIKKQFRIADKSIDDVLEFAHIKQLELTQIDPNGLVEDTLRNIPLSENIDIARNFKNDLPRITVDTLQIQQTILNIIANAIEAMEKKGTLRVSTDKQTTDDSKKEFVSISFKDTGKGISKDHLEKIFEPLFTTKTKGTGLGLSVCENIIKAHKGSIEVESEVGKGSTFIVKLPV